jgi:hypothetical protein
VGWYRAPWTIGTKVSQGLSMGESRLHILMILDVWCWLDESPSSNLRFENFATFKLGLLAFPNVTRKSVKASGPGLSPQDVFKLGGSSMIWRHKRILQFDPCYPTLSNRTECWERFDVFMGWVLRVLN